MNVYLRCIVSNLKMVIKILTFPPLDKILRTPMVLGQQFCGLNFVTSAILWPEKSSSGHPPRKTLPTPMTVKFDCCCESMPHVTACHRMSPHVTACHRMLQPGPALADAGPNARIRCGAPLSSDYHVIVFSQPCYDRGRAQIGNSLVLTRAFFVNNEISMTFQLNSQGKVYLANMNNLPKHHGAGHQRRGAQCSCIGCIGVRPALAASSPPLSYNIRRFVACDS